MAYFKSDGADNFILCVVNLDERNQQSGWVQVPLEKMGIGQDEQYTVNDLISESSYFWKGEWNYVELRPPGIPFHLFKVKKI